MAKLIVLRPLLTIRKGFVRLVYLFKFCLCLRVVRMQIGMILFSQFAVSRFDFIIACVLLNAQNLVIISFLRHLKSPETALRG